MILARGRIKARMHGLNAVEHAYERLWSMAYRTWQIEHRGEFRLALRRATSLPRGNKRDYVPYKTLVRWRFACGLRGGARGFWFIDPLGLRPRGLCTVATRARHVNHAPPSYNYNVTKRSYQFSSEVIVRFHDISPALHHSHKPIPLQIQWRLSVTLCNTTNK